jgi:serine/threonine-protein kinase HipA
MKKCLYCLADLQEEVNADFHSKCSSKFFGNAKAPELPYTLDSLSALAKSIVERSITVTGVQPKLSLAFEKNIKEGISRLTLVGLWGDYILKPPNQNFTELVENEHLTMSLANTFGLRTVSFSYIRLQSGELAYLTKRIDRTKTGKLQMEDFCQLSERLTEYKYRGSVEQLAKIIKQYSSDPGLDLVNLIEIALFSFLTGNADMHLKNYSMITNLEEEVRLAPAYDLVATKLAMPSDMEESALTINGKKSRLKKLDFEALAKNAGLSNGVFERILVRFQKKMPLVVLQIQNSFLSETLKIEYTALIEQRAERLFAPKH